MATTQIRGNTQILADTITNAQINSAAGIATTKLADSANFILRGGSVAFTAPQSMGSNKLTNVADGTVSTDAATYGQLLNLVNGKAYKDAVRAKSTANVTLSGPQILDGVTLSNNDRVACFSQTTTTQDGLYIVNTAGAWTRTADFPVGASVASVTFRVQEGTTNADTEWTITNDSSSAVVGTNDLVLAQSGSGGTYTNGTGLTLTGNTFAADFGNTAGKVTQGNDARLSDARTPIGTTLNSSQIIVGSITNVAAAVTMSGDATLSNTGALTVASTIVKIANVVTRETPTGVINGSNTIFVLANTPVSGTEHVYLNGILQEPGAGNDYTIATSTITFLSPPVTLDKIRVTYYK